MAVTPASAAAPLHTPQGWASAPFPAGAGKGLAGSLSTQESLQLRDLGKGKPSPGEWPNLGDLLSALTPKVTATL